MVVSFWRFLRQKYVFWFTGLTYICVSVIEKFMKKSSVFQSSIVLWVAWILFAVGTLFVGAHHEPWADEAQAWLIGRDATVWEILSEYARCEGQPVLWHLILKSLIWCGLPYSVFYLVPWVFSVAGVGLFLWKAPFPKWVKTLIPFTYFIFFQYTIVGRQYCLALLLLSWIATIYADRHNRPYLYALALCLFGFSSTPGLLISGSLYFLFLCENLCLKANRTKNWLSAGLIFIFMLAMLAMLWPDLSNPFFTHQYGKVTPIERFFILLPSIVTMTFFTTMLDSWSLNTALYIATVLFIGRFFWRDKKHLLAVLVLYIPLLVLFAVLISQSWHLGHLFLLLIFCLWIFYDGDLFKSSWKNIHLWLLTALLIFHACISARFGWYDIKYPFSIGKEVAHYVEPYQKNGKTILGTNFWIVAVQPYFSKNISVNWDKSFWIHKADAKNYRLLEFLSENQWPDVILTDINNSMEDEGKAFFNQINASGLYEPGIVFPRRKPQEEELWDFMPIAVFIKKETRKTDPL